MSTLFLCVMATDVFPFASLTLTEALSLHILCNMTCNHSPLQHDLYLSAEFEIFIFVLLVEGILKGYSYPFMAVKIVAHFWVQVKFKFYDQAFRPFYILR